MPENTGQSAPDRQPIVSVAIPVYNGEEYLAEALQSVLAQTVAADQFVVYDNASTDSSAAIARGLIPAASVIVRDQNIGAIGNFNSAATSSSTDAAFFMWLAADDRIRPRFIESCIAELAKQPEAPACLAGVSFIDANGAETGTQTDLPLASPIPGVRFRSFLRRRRWTEFYCLYRRDALLKSPLMLPAYGPDVLLTWWFLLRAPLAVTTEVLLEYRIATEKTVQDVLADLDPSTARTHWQMVALWRNLWKLTYDAEVVPKVARTARRSLVLSAFHPTWIVHFSADATQRWPRFRPAALAVRDRIRLHRSR